MTDPRDVQFCPECDTPRALAMEQCPKCGAKKKERGYVQSPQEKKIEAEVIRWYRQLGFKAWKSSQYKRLRGADPGYPDVTALGFNLTLFTETKALWGRQSDEQGEFEKAVQNAGRDTYYLMPRSVDELQEFVLRLIKAST